MAVLVYGPGPGVSFTFTENVGGGTMLRHFARCTES